MQESLFPTVNVDPGSLQDCFDAWVAHRQRSDKTLRASSVSVYRHKWGSFVAHLISQDEELRGLDVARVATFLARLGPKVTLRYRKRLLKLIEWVLEVGEGPEVSLTRASAREILASEPYRYAETQEHETLPRTFNQTQAHLIIQKITQRMREGQWTDQRNVAVAAVMLGSGIKPGEARLLKLDHIVYAGADSTRGMPEKLAIPGNGYYGAREVVLEAWARTVLADWLRVREGFRFSGDAVFPSDLQGVPIHKSTLHRGFKRLLADLGVRSGKASPHALRHTWAVDKRRDGVPLAQVKDALGLELISSARPYDRVAQGRSRGV